MNYEVIDGMGPEFEKVFCKVRKIMEALPGHDESDLYKKATDPNAYLIISVWSDQNAFRDFTNSEQFINVVDWGRENCLVTKPRHEIYGEPISVKASCPADAH